MHVVGALVQGMKAGDRPFEGITAALALKMLREALLGVGVADAQLYRCHDLRRGHAKDLQESGAPLWVILAAGEWKSPAFLAYLDLHRLETDMVIQVIGATSSVTCFSKDACAIARRIAMSRTKNLCKHLVRDQVRPSYNPL